MPVKEMTDPDATLDGSDVLFTGQEFFIGRLSIAAMDFEI